MNEAGRASDNVPQSRLESRCLVKDATESCGDLGLTGINRHSECGIVILFVKAARKGAQGCSFALHAEEESSNNWVWIVVARSFGQPLRRPRAPLSRNGLGAVPAAA